jgi:SAM-dependent methyltransferase
MDLKELESGVNPEIHWYYQSKILPLIAFTKKVLKTTSSITIVDVGSGSGFFALTLEKYFSSQIKKVYLVDIGYSHEEIESTRNAKIQKTLKIPTAIDNGLVIMMDVLEHLPDDYKMLCDIKASCKGHTNNHFFITVPAFQSLWSGHDDFLGHYRRYKVDTLTAVLRRAEYNIGNCFYLYGMIFIPVFILRKIKNMLKDKAASNMKPSASIVNSILYRVNALEMKVARANKMFGVTCAAEGTI